MRETARIIAALDASPAAKNTIVVVWSDHGWHLGEKQHLHKFTLWERSTRVPFIVMAPGVTRAGTRSVRPVGLVDLFPTLNELCGLPPSTGLEGISFAPLVDNPDKPWKKAAFSQYPRGSSEHGELMGYSMRTDRYRLTLWKKRAGGAEVAAELFDYEKDPDERQNLAGDPAYGNAMKDLRAQFNAGWRGALPR